MAICVFSTISYSIVKCSFVCLFVNALDPCKINIEQYTNVVFYTFQLNIDRNKALPSLVCVYVCLSGCLAALFSALVCVCVCVCACVSVCTIL